MWHTSNLLKWTKCRSISILFLKVPLKTFINEILYAIFYYYVLVKLSFVTLQYIYIYTRILFFILNIDIVKEYVASHYHIMSFYQVQCLRQSSCPYRGTRSIFFFIQLTIPYEPYVAAFGFKTERTRRKIYFCSRRCLFSVCKLYWKLFFLFFCLIAFFLGPLEFQIRRWHNRAVTF